MRFTLVPALAIAIALALVGCNRQSFEVSVTNRTNVPLTVGVVKDGPPEEEEWSSPDQLAIHTQLEFLRPWGHQVPPGRTMDSGKITGDFPAGTRAYVRIYRGVHSNAELIGMGTPAMGRLDVLLFPGGNHIIVQDDPKKGLIARHVEEAP